MSDITKYGGRGQTLSANADSIGDIVGRAAADMARAEKAEKISLRDMEKIQAASRDYLRECAAAGILPTTRGVASRLGVTRQALYDYSKHHPGGEFDAWLQDFSDICAELTMEAAMAGSVKEVSAIFVSKARYNWRDSLTLEVTPPDSPLGKDVEPEMIAAQYESILED